MFWNDGNEIKCLHLLFKVSLYVSPIKDLRSDNNNARELVGSSSSIESEVRSILCDFILGVLE